MSSSERTSPGRVPGNGRAGQTATVPAQRAASNGHGRPRPKLADAAKLPAPAPKVAPVRIGPHLYRVPVSGGIWAMSTDESPDGPLPRGLWQREADPDSDTPRWARRSDLPFVHARVVRRDGSGQQIDTDYLLSGPKDGPRVLVPAARVRNGEWAGAVGLPQSADRKVIDAAGTAIFCMKPLTGDYASKLEAVPRIGPDSKVTVPVAEALPTGYFQTGALSRPEALARWRNQVVPVAVGNPKLALAMGAGTSGPYLGALARQSHLLNMDGDSDQGKSTAMKVTAGLWGNPFIKGGLLGSWSGTRVRLPRRLGLLGILPCFLDERGMADFASPAEWGKAIYAITDGPREVAESRGSGLRLTAPWDGVLVSAGNGSLLDGLGAGPYAGVGIKRVVSLRAPFTRSADEAEAVIDALRDAYGHPGRAVIEAFTVPEVARLIREAIPLVGMPAGGNPRSLAKNLHGHVAGAAMLDQIFGTGTALRDAAAVAARDYLAEHGHEPDHDADRMLTLIRDCMAAQPARWPTVSEYREHRLPRPEYGHDGQPADPDRIELPQHGVDRSVAGVLADDGSWFAVVGSALDELLTHAGADRAAALAEADQRGWLHRTATDRSKGKMATFVKGLGRMYRFALPAEDDEPEDPADTIAPEPEPEPSPEPAPDQCPACGRTRPLHDFDCAALDPVPPEWPDEYEDEDQGVSEPVPAALVPAAVPVPVPAAVAEPETIEAPFGAEIRRYLADCAASPQLDRKYHPTADGAVKMIAHHGKAEADMIRAAFADAVTGAESTPEPTPEAVPEPDPEPVRPAPVAAAAPELEPARVEDQDHAGKPGPADRNADELAAFTREVLSAYPAAEPADIAAALDLFHEAYGLRFIRNASWTGITTLRRDVALFGSKSEPQPRSLPVLAEIHEAGPLRHLAFVVPGQRVREGLHFTGWDINGQHPAAAGSSYLGTGEPEYADSPRTVAPFLGMPGYVRLGQQVRTGHPAYGTLPRGRWVTMPHAKFLAADLGIEIPAAGVLYWGRGNASKHLATFTARYRKAREMLNGRNGLPADYARAVVKAVANKTVGMLRSEDHNRTEFYVPDWYDQIVSTAEANMLRHLRKIERAGGGLPIGKCADAAWWVSRTEREHPAGLEASAQLGKWKLEKSGLVTPRIVSAYRDRDPGGLQSAIKAADTARREGGQR